MKIDSFVWNGWIYIGLPYLIKFELYLYVRLYIPIWLQSVAVIRSSSMKRGYETKHLVFVEQYQVVNSLRKSKIEMLSLNNSTLSVIIKNAMSK